MPRYLGPADVLVHDGRAYRPGENVPLSKAEQDALRRTPNRHRFEGDEEPVIVGVNVAPGAAVPMGDDSRPMQGVKNAELKHAPAAVSPAQAAAPEAAPSKS